MTTGLGFIQVGKTYINPNYIVNISPKEIGYDASGKLIGSSVTTYNGKEFSFKNTSEEVAKGAIKAAQTGKIINLDA
ncbi:hypothetical protein II906_12725 [bacterium]|nr:hypothetical protein [bacterium]